MPKIVVTNCWSYYNKGDAAIAIATVNLIHDINKENDITLMAVDSSSFSLHQEAFNCPINVLPMLHTIQPLNKTRLLFSAVQHISKKYIPSIGILYLLLQMPLLMISKIFSKRLRQVTSKIDEADLIVAVGGNYLWSNEGFYNQILPLIYAKLVKKKRVILLGHSIGPFERGIDRQLAKFLLSKFDMIIFREIISYNYVNENLLPLKNAIVSSDYSFMLEEIVVKSSLKKKVIGISIRKWLETQPALFNRYLVSLKTLIESLSEKGYHFYLIPFSYLSGQENDLELCRHMIELLDPKYRENVEIYNFKEHDPNKIIKILDELEIKILIGTRLHSVIMAFMAKIPSVIISYQHFKTLGLAKQLGIEDNIIKIEKVDSTRLLDAFLVVEQSMKENMFSPNISSIRNDIFDITEKIMSKMLIS